ncbi:hypothetical protein [Burkholderia sp. THE68]|uniref:hypothetical protein n=1 Tax=Burkholderia sp. THE68 TaxID=758782 RepID=UPI00138996D4|nr:hypothetical protein [Burkholderia sp. THE68]
MKKSLVMLAVMIQFLCFDVALAEGLCLYKEREIFNCEFSQSMSSLCESSDGSIIYRSGEKNKIKLEISNRRKENFFYLSSRPLVGGGETHVRFNNGEYTYYMFDRMSVTKDGSDSSAGVIAFKNGRIIFNRTCANDASVRQRGYQILPREDFNDIR